MDELDLAFKRLSSRGGSRPRLAQQQYQFVAYTKRRRKKQPASKVKVPDMVKRAAIERTCLLSSHLDAEKIEALMALKEELR